MKQVLYTSTNPFNSDDFFGLECDTPDDAYDFADNYFAEECEAHGIQSDNAEITIIGFTINEDTGKRDVLSVEDRTVGYEYYKGDYAEHNTLWGTS